MDRFVQGYLGPHRDDELAVLDIGSQIVTEGHITYRTLFDAPSWTYTGLDVEPGLNVDIAVAQPYRWDEVAADAYDVVISGQALEHVQYFWLTAFEIGRALRPGGITMLIAPSSGFEHRHPVDCWRIYRDGMDAIATYLGFEILDSFTDWNRPMWADSMLVMRKPIWTDELRTLFARRREWQQAAAWGSEPLATVTQAPTAPSVLAACLPGLLSPVLEQIRTEALAPPTPEPEPAPVEAPAQSAWRTRVKRLVGPRVLGLYRRVRHRS